MNPVGGDIHAVTPVLRAFIMRRLGASADVEDVVQNILLSIHRAGHTYDTQRPFKIWMFAIAIVATVAAAALIRRRDFAIA